MSVEFAVRRCLADLFRKLGCAAVCFAACGSVFADEEVPIQPVEVKLDGELNFERDVYPALKKNCLACHNSLKSEGEFNMETAASIIQGGESGEAIVPGEPDESYLYLLASRESEPVMPPLPNQMNAHRLTGEEVWKLRRWIELGAKGELSQKPKQIAWTGVPAHLRPIYTIELFPREADFVIGRGNRVEVRSLLDPSQAVALTDPDLGDVAHRDFVNALAVHPSGTVIASAGYRVVKLWQKQAPAARVVAGLDDGAKVAAVSPGGGKIIVANPAGKVLFGVPDQLQAWESGQEGLEQLAISTGGDWLAVGRGNALTVVSSQALNAPLTATTESPIRALGWSGNTLWVGLEAGPIVRWSISGEPAALTAVGEPLASHTAAVVELTPLPGDPGGVVSRDAAGTILLWQGEQPTVAKQWAAGGDVVACVYHPANTRLATVHQNGRVVVWDGNQKSERTIQQSAGLELAKRDLERQLVVRKAITQARAGVQKVVEKDLQDRQAALKKAEEAAAAAVQERDKLVAPLEMATAKQKEIADKITAEGETDALKKEREAAQKALDEAQQKLNAAEETLARAQKTVTIEQGSVAKAEQKLAAEKAAAEQAAAAVTQTEAALKAATEALAAQPLTAIGARFENGNLLRVIAADGTVQDWNLLTGQPIRSVPLADGVTVTAWSAADNQHGLLRTADNQLQWCDWGGDWQLRAKLGPPPGVDDLNLSMFVDRVSALAFSPDGNLLATGGGDPSRSGELLLWDWASGQIASEFPEAHSDVVLSVAFADDGTQLLSGAADKFVRVHALPSGEVVRSFEGHTEHVLGVAWSADGLTVASGSADKTIKIWNMLDGTQKRTISSASKQVTDLAFVGTTENVVSSGGDRLVRMYQTGNGRNYRNLSGSQNYLYSVAVTSGEEFVISGGQNGVIRIWDGQKGNLLHTLED